MISIKAMSQQCAADEAKVRGEVSELYLLLKSGKLSDEEKARVKARLDEMIASLEAEKTGTKTRVRDSNGLKH